jgi:hypothetical protein
MRQSRIIESEEHRKEQIRLETWRQLALILDRTEDNLTKHIVKVKKSISLPLIKLNSNETHS